MSFDDLVSDIKLVIANILERPVRLALALTSRSNFELLFDPSLRGLSLALECIRTGNSYLLSFFQTALFFPLHHGRDLIFDLLMKGHIEVSLETFDLLFPYLPENSFEHDEFVVVYASMLSRVPPTTFPSIFESAHWRRAIGEVDLPTSLPCSWLPLLFEELVARGALHFLKRSMEQHRGSEWSSLCNSLQNSVIIMALRCDDIVKFSALYRWANESPQAPNDEIFQFLFSYLGHLTASPNLLAWVADFAKENPTLERNLNESDMLNTAVLIEGHASFTPHPLSIRLFLKNRILLRAQNPKALGCLLRNSLKASVRTLDLDLFNVFQEYCLKLMGHETYLKFLRLIFTETNYVDGIALPHRVTFPNLRSRFTAFMSHIIRTTPSFLGNVIPYSPSLNLAHVEDFILLGNRSLFELLFSEKVPIDPSRIVDFFRLPIFAKLKADPLLELVDIDLLKFLVKKGISLSNSVLLEECLMADQLLEALTLSSIRRPGFRELMDLLLSFLPPKPKEPSPLDFSLPSYFGSEFYLDLLGQFSRMQLSLRSLHVRND